MRTAAIAFVVEAGRRDGNEHAVLFDARSGEIVASYTSGEPGRVGPDGDARLLSMLDNPEMALEQFHNHPLDCSLSLPDLRFHHDNPAVRSVVAASHDGSVYEGRVLSSGDKIAKADDKFRRRWNKKIPPMNLDFDPRRAFHHCRNLFLARKGLIRYAFVLSPRMAGLWRDMRSIGATTRLRLEKKPPGNA